MKPAVTKMSRQQVEPWTRGDALPVWFSQSGAGSQKKNKVRAQNLLSATFTEGTPPSFLRHTRDRDANGRIDESHDCEEPPQDAIH